MFRNRSGKSRRTGPAVRNLDNSAEYEAMLGLRFANKKRFSMRYNHEGVHKILGNGPFLNVLDIPRERHTSQYQATVTDMQSMWKDTG